MPGLDRRTVLKHSAALALTAGLPATEALAQTTLLRRPVSAMAGSDPILVSYRAAVKKMKELPTSDPRNWTRQAQIHQGSSTLRCPHGNWFFLPWHRAYLVAFERICRQLSGNPNFALPYWDWTANPQLPAAFAFPTRRLVQLLRHRACGSRWRQAVLSDRSHHHGVEASPVPARDQGSDHGPAHAGADSGRS